MNKLAFCLTGILVLGGAASAQPNQWVTNVEVQNASEYSINHLYLSPSGTDSWGEDLLGAAFLMPGNSVTFRLSCASDRRLYDIKLVDHDQDVCVLFQQNLCLPGTTMTITTQNLLACE